MSTVDEVRVLKLTLHDALVGYLAGFQNGRNVLTFDDNFKLNPDRPTFSLITQPSFPKADELLDTPWARHQRLHPVLSNLLPEGTLRELLAQGLKTHIDNEFEIFTHLGQDLPGALIATPLSPNDIPQNTYGKAKAVKIQKDNAQNHFSLAGVQMKFSMKEKDGRYHMTQSGDLGDWIIKTPSTTHKGVPLNEYTAMTLAALAGVNIPEIKLVPLESLEKLPQINLPNEQFAFAVRRFDRANNLRIHMEDFAQVFVKYPRDKYDSANYEQIGKVIYQYTGDSLGNAQQFARRLLVNILLANGDAHLKNWSLLYADKFTPELSPAYDIVTTRVYIENESKFALNLGKTKEWYQATYAHFQTWAEKSDIPWRAIKPHLDDTLDKARTLWPKALKDLPMEDTHKAELVKHWLMLQEQLRIGM
jgi:serine/threonine-protein kinase HipA